MLHIHKLQVGIDDKTILNTIDLNIKKGRTHAIMGPNGSGKSTLAYVLAGHPSYCIINGTIILDGKNIIQLSPDKRAQAGLFLAFQHPPAIAGVSVMTFLKEAHHAITGKTISIPEFKILLEQYMQQLHIDPLFAHRNLHDGFSGGERKKFEMLQLFLLKPKVAILDEIDSGLDIDALKIVAKGVHLARKENPDLSILLITHYQRILHYIQPDEVHILCDGNIITSGDVQLAYELEQKGYDAFKHATH